ncbi:endonuclease/exonuclease/phosphatase family protein, partial [Cooperia oncophora]
MLLNARSIVNKITDLHFLMHNEPEGIFITESWCKPWTVHDAILSHGSAYRVYRCDRQGDRVGGGVAALIHSRVSHHFLAARDFHSNIQTITLQIDYEFIEYLNSLYSEWTNQILILGDFNFPLIDWPNMVQRANTSMPGSSSFLKFVSSYSLKQMVKEPTHGLNILDILLVSEPTIIRNLKVLPPFSTSDHCSVSFEIVGRSLPTLRKSVLRKAYSKADFESINASLARIDWISLHRGCDSTNAFYLEFLNICNELIEKYVPNVRVKNNHERYPKRIRLLRAKVDHLFSLSQNVNNAEYKKFSMKLKRALAKHRVLIEKQIASCKNSKRFFSYCKKNLKLAESIPNLISH